MSIEDCIADALKAGKITPKGAKEYGDRMKDAVAQAEQRKESDE